MAHFSKSDVYELAATLRVLNRYHCPLYVKLRVNIRTPAPHPWAVVMHDDTDRIAGDIDAGQCRLPGRSQPFDAEVAARHLLEDLARRLERLTAN